MYYYAQLDDSGVCAAVSALAGEVGDENLVAVSEGEYAGGDLLGREYVNETWGEKV